MSSEEEQAKLAETMWDLFNNPSHRGFVHNLIFSPESPFHNEIMTLVQDEARKMAATTPRHGGGRGYR